MHTRTFAPIALAVLLDLSGCARSARVRKLDDPPSREAGTAASRAAPVTAEQIRGADATDQFAPEPETPQTPAWLGVELALRAPEAPGVLVRAVVPDSPAERAGVVQGDVILSIDGQHVGRPAEVVTLVSSQNPGARVGLTVLRGEQERLFAATLEPQPNEEAMLRKRYVDVQAPNLVELTTVRGSVNPSLAELRGNVVVVEFWAGWCVPCRITAPLLSSWNDRYSPEGLRVLGVTSEPVVQAADAAARHGMTYAIFSDESGKTTLSYRAFALPTLFVIDRRGVVRDVMVGFSSSRLKEIEGLLERLLAER